MHNPTRVFTFVVLILGTAAFLPPPAHAVVALPWSTTYNCANWTQSDGLYPPAISCDGLRGEGAWTCDNGDGTVREEQITAAANYPGGAGAKGQRHWKGDGANVVSGGLTAVFTSAQPELWVRWYMRYEKGFQWNPLNNDKILYIDVGMPNFVVFGPNWTDQLIFEVYGNPYADGTGNGWNTIMANGSTDARGNKTSDGLWHEFEIHIKMDTNGSDGIAEAWVDGTKRFTRTDVNFGSQTGKTGWSHILIGSNNRYPANGRCMYVDFDDLAIRTTGPIGPVGPGDTLAPAAPSNLTVQ